MLTELKVKDFAIISSTTIQFTAGLNIISGETGAGKSLILKSLALLMGDKATADTVRNGCDQAEVNGVFDLDHRPDIIERLISMGIEVPDSQLVVRRIVAISGKNRVYLNGQPSVLTNLRDVVAPLIESTGTIAPLIEMTGQHDNRHLQSRSFHLDMLDSFCGNWPLRVDYVSLFEKWQETKNTLHERISQRSQREQQLDFLKYQESEIAQLELNPAVDQLLAERVQELKRSHEVQSFIGHIEETLYSADNAVLVQLHQILQKAQGLKLIDSGSIGAHFQQIQQAKTWLEDSVYSLREYIKALTEEFDQLEAMEDRLSQIRKLQKKYGEDLSEILEQQAQFRAEIRMLENLDHDLALLEKDVLRLELSAKAKALNLHQNRLSAAQQLADQVNRELKDLNMKGVQFDVMVDSLNDLGASGSSQVEFMLKNSAHDEPRPLAKFASGGELSRILLALKNCVGRSQLPRTYLFDEVDAGVSGETAERVGRKLKLIANNQQVICVTHLPQVAAAADTHFSITKANIKGEIKMRVTQLESGLRVEEVARLMSGEKLTQSSIDHARELISSQSQFKN